MAQYIDKDALVAEIKRLSDIISQGMFTDESRLGIEYFKERVLSFLDTLEVKEVDSKDVFIEKACEWLRTHSEDDYFELIPDANYCGAGILNKKRMIEDFEEYLKK